MQPVLLSGNDLTGTASFMNPASSGSLIRERL